MINDLLLRCFFGACSLTNCGDRPAVPLNRIPASRRVATGRSRHGNISPTDGSTRWMPSDLEPHDQVLGGEKSTQADEHLLARNRSRPCRRPSRLLPAREHARDPGLWQHIRRQWSRIIPTGQGWRTSKRACGRLPASGCCQEAIIGNRPQPGLAGQRQGGAHCR